MPFFKNNNHFTSKEFKDKRNEALRHISIRESRAYKPVKLVKPERKEGEKGCLSLANLTVAARKHRGGAIAVFAHWHVRFAKRFMKYHIGVLIEEMPRKKIKLLEETVREHPFKLHWVDSVQTSTFFKWLETFELDKNLTYPTKSWISKFWTLHSNTTYVFFIFLMNP